MRAANGKFISRNSLPCENCATVEIHKRKKSADIYIVLLDGENEEIKSKN